MSTALKSPESARIDIFTQAVESLARKLGVAASETPMPISKFKSDYSGLLRDARAGQQETRHGQAGHGHDAGLSHRRALAQHLRIRQGSAGRGRG